jgi:hypothetical protein
MAIMKIICPRCARHGFVSAHRLPSIPHCADCGLARMVRSGGKVVRSHLAANIDAQDDDKLELFKPAAKAPASRKWLDRHDNLAVARTIY